MVLSITSVHNPRIKHAVHLRDRRHRDRHSQILIDGAREVSQALLSGTVRLQEVFVCRELCSAARAQAALNEIQSRLEPIWVSPAVFEKIAYGDRQDGIIGIAERPLRELADLTLPSDACVAVLEGVEKPGNIGAVMRSADAAGIAALICANPRTDLYNPNAIRASLGTIFRLPACEAQSDAVLKWLRGRQTRIYVARVDGSRTYTEVDYSGPVALVLGSEAAGASGTWSGPDITPIHIPMRGMADSLNVSAAAAVLFFEVLRQRST